MLGWEYPPHISGGLGTACEGLTQGLSAEGIEIVFVVPRAGGREDAPHMTFVGLSGMEKPVKPARVARALATIRTSRERPAEAAQVAEAIEVLESADPEELASVPVRKGNSLATMVTTHRVDSLLRPYDTPVRYKSRLVRLVQAMEVEAQEAETHQAAPAKPTKKSKVVKSAVLKSPALNSVVAKAGSAESVAAAQAWEQQQESHYGDDLMNEVNRYAILTAAVAEQYDFDIVHAHDWMTYPAALLLASRGYPVVLHAHSLESDRSGEHVHPQIDAIEGAGFQWADHVIAVSHYTRSQVLKRHPVAADRISVVHNGVTRSEGLETYHIPPPAGDTKLVVFLGRITFQKGPEYFIRAAAKVLPRFPKARFVMAGSGDMLPSMQDLVRSLGLSDYFEFPGFVSGAAKEKLLMQAHVYVMPSVSEPFGIAPLEAMAYNTPVIISRQSGVSEVLSHALKVDFWDVDRLAKLILAVLRHDALSSDMQEMASMDLLKLHWKAAAQKTVAVYERVLQAVTN